VSELVTLERDGAQAPLLVVTNLWPDEGRPDFGIFVKRQVDSVRRLGIGCDVLAINSGRSMAAFAAAARRLAEMSMARSHHRLTHAHGGEAALAARFHRGPLVVSYTGSDLLGASRPDGQVSWRWRARRAAIRQHARSATATVTKSQEMEEVLPKSVRASNRVIPNGVDRNLFKPVNRDQARAELGWDRDARVALFAADPELPYKRYDLAVAACDQAAGGVGTVRLEVAQGVPPERMPLLMSAADCLVHPSASEGSPNVVKEALSCNLPVVATPVGDIPELLTGIEACRVVPPEVSALAAALGACLDPPRRSNGRALSAHLDEARVAEKVADLYAEVVGLDLRTS
jgi:glycosyltransferase involved in cell wall biosynthesis